MVQLFPFSGIIKLLWWVWYNTCKWLHFFRLQNTSLFPSWNLEFLIVNNLIIVIDQWAICTKRSCDIIFMKMKVIWFCLRKTISGSYFKQNNSDLWFSNRHHFLEMSKFVAGHVTKMWLNTNFALKVQVKCWKDNVVTFTAPLSVTINRLTRYKQKVVLAGLLEGKSMPSNMAANTNHTNCWKIKVP